MISMETGQVKLGELHFERSTENTLTINVSGEWKLTDALPSSDALMREIDAATQPQRIVFNTQGLEGWDSGLLTFLIRLKRHCSGKDAAIDYGGLPHGVQRLLDLSSVVPERKEAHRESIRVSLLTHITHVEVSIWHSILETLSFLGEVSVAFLKFFTGRARFRRSDLMLTLEECGADALPIVSLISFLVGLILAFVGSIQLKMFGAQIFIADLVGIAMTRAMGAIMVGIIMAGRTGAAFAARIGTMQVNEEIDALKTAGISPVEFLVLPRVIAMTLMMPLLALYADLMGMLGGLIVSVTGFGIGVNEYFQETKDAVGMANIWIGLFSSFVFGILVSFTGCLRGMQCGRSASAVGDATTSAVVTSIVSIVVATAIITVLCDVLGI
ncbi:MAG: putative phospholipid ABC transporter permease protein MlaE [Syntrophorhabdus sp. PtaU1.Bin058]|nr:MAG: putative phospholipid ABC transporter permease protein MlaE [Syntrophorhabdus sp. PtaU1.Bin058]